MSSMNHSQEETTTTSQVEDTNNGPRIVVDHQQMDGQLQPQPQPQPTSSLLEATTARTSTITTTAAATVTTTASTATRILSMGPPEVNDDRANDRTTTTTATTVLLSSTTTTPVTTPIRRRREGSTSSSSISAINSASTIGATTAAWDQLVRDAQNSSNNNQIHYNPNPNQNQRSSSLSLSSSSHHNTDHHFHNNNNNHNHSTNQQCCRWTDVMEAGSIMPTARSLHSAAVLNGNLYVFGGYDGTTRVNSFHAYSFVHKRWSPVLPSMTSGNPPSPRDRHVSVTYGDSFYVHGGFDGSVRDGSLHAFDFSSLSWREILPSHGRPPSARHSHSAVVHGHSMYIFGGYDGSYKNDLHQYDFTTNRWSLVPVSGRRPGPRYRASCVIYNDSMVLYGGHDGTRHLSDTFIFDFRSLNWSPLITEGKTPSPRDSHVAVVHGNSMYVFGGSSGNALNDLHVLVLPPTEDSSTRTTNRAVASATTTTTTSASTTLTVGTAGERQHTTSPTAVTPTNVARWRPITDGNRPLPRFCHVAVTYEDAMYVFGGYDGSNRINSFMKFDFDVYITSIPVPPSTLHTNLRSYVNCEKFADVIFVVENQYVYAHKFILMMRSPYFERYFNGYMRESNEHDTTPKVIEHIRYPIFLGILEYLYTDQLPTKTLPPPSTTDNDNNNNSSSDKNNNNSNNNNGNTNHNFTFDMALEYFEAADRFDIARLRTLCERIMLQYITIENAAILFHQADRHSAYLLRLKCKNYVILHFDDVSKTPAFEDMCRENIDLLIEILNAR